MDCDSIGELLCRRADKLNAAVLLMAKHKRGAVKEFFIGRWADCRPMLDAQQAGYFQSEQQVLLCAACAVSVDQ